MKYVLICLAVLFAALPSLSFAQPENACEMGCCGAAGGTWDSDFGSCDNPSSSYYECINNCEGAMGFNYSCCGAGFVLLSILAGGLFLSRKQ